MRVDGTPRQDAEVDLPRVIGVDQGWTWHAELAHGITPERVLSEVISHDDPDWAAGDADLS